jgi:hypothetical protein
MADNAPAASPHRFRVNGALLGKFHGKPVCALGTVVRADGGGTSFQMKASDGQQLNVRLKSPIAEPLDGVVEVYGIGQGKNLIIADSYAIFPEECTNKFDMGTYNEAVKVIHSIEGDLNPWNPSS